MTQTSPLPRTKSQIMPGGLLFASLALLASCLVLGAIWGGVLRLPRISGHLIGPSFEITAALLGIWLLGLGVFWAKKHRRFDPFEPPIWFSLNIYLQIVMNVWLLQRDRLPWIPWLRNNYSTMMPLANILFGVALTSLWSGYAVAYRGMAKNLSEKKTREPAAKLSNTYALWFLTWLIGIYAALGGASSYLGSGTAGLWTNYFRFVTILGSAATAILVIRHFRRPTVASRLWLAMVIGVQIILSLIAGSKGFATFFIWLIMCYYYSKRKFPKFFFVFAAAAVVLLVPAVNSFRRALHAIDPGGGVLLAPRAKALSGALKGVSRSSFQNLFEDTERTFKNRQGEMLAITASVLTLHPKPMPYVGEKMIAGFFSQLVPRVFWPGKPVKQPEFLKIATVYTGARAEYAFAAIGLPADAYRAGGWAFVIIFFFILGAFMAWLYVRGPGRGTLFGVVLYITLIFYILTYDQDISTMLIHLIQFGLLTWLVLKWGLFRRLNSWNSAHK